jgi:RNA polymerase sigma factor (sigma-70 family)
MTPGPLPQDFDDWYMAARPKLLRLAQSRLRDRAEAEDVVQETAVALWNQLQRQPIDNLDAYAARAVWQNSLRRLTRRKDWATLDAEDGFEPSVPPDIEQAIDAWEMEEALAQLPLPQQAVLRLRFYAGHSFQETADALSIGLNTAASRVRYALQSLRTVLNPSQEESSEQRNPEPRPKPAAKPRRKPKPQPR